MACSAEPGRTSVRLCGGFAVEIDGRPLADLIRGRQMRLLLSYLVLHRERPVRREELVEALWPDRRPEFPDNALNTLVSRLRNVLGDGVICGRSELTLDLAEDASVDIESAFEAILRAEQSLANSCWEEATRAADVALSVAERGLLGGIDASWADDARRRVDEVGLRALECLAACGLGLGGSRLSSTERAARRLIEAAPYRETGYRYLMQAFAARGRVAEALRVFDDARVLLQAELGVAPSAGLRALHEGLLNDQPIDVRSDRVDPLAARSAMTTAFLTQLVCSADAPSERVRELRELHERLLRAPIAAHGGQRGTYADDGFLAFFDDARAAIDCAVHFQQAVELHNRKLHNRGVFARVALHGREAVGGDETNAAIAAIARQLCERAEAGQILASAPLRSFAGPQHHLRELHAAEIDGVTRPLGVVEVAWQAVEQPSIALPVALTVRDKARFVGRDEHLGRLWRLYQEVRSGARHVAFIRGDPGIGKTRLVAEVALRAHADGAVVLYGRCDEDPLLPYQPFVEALQHYVGACPLAELAAQVGASSGELRRLVPELAERVLDLAQPLAGDSQGERYRLSEAVIGLLCRAAEARPVVLVLDDLHWADRPSLLLLKHLARRTHATALLVLGTYRDVDFQPGRPLAETLADVGREPGCQRLLLGPLDMASVARLATFYAGDQASGLVELVCRDTEGNPFFVVETLRHLTERGVVGVSPGERSSDRRLADFGLPEGVKDLIGRRIARLSPATRRVLCIAAVSGREFEQALLADISGLDEEQLVEALDEAVRARVIDEQPSPVGRYSFTHALIRDAIYTGLTGTRRALLHRRLAASLETRHAADPDAVSAELAHHFVQAGDAGDLAKVIEYATRAGGSALARLAYEQAATHYRLAARLIESTPARQATCCDLLIAQGEAERQAGDPAYRATLLGASRLARDLEDAERLTRAALANNRGFFSAMAGVDHERVSVLEAALDAEDERDSVARASLLAHLALELVPAPDWQRRTRLSDEALAIARRLGDAPALARTLNFRYVALWGPRTLPERLANTKEAAVIADQLEDPILSFQAARFGSHAAMEAGDLPLADRLLERAGELDAKLLQPTVHWYLWSTRAKRASISGPPAAAERLARDAFEIGRRAGQPDAGLWLALQLFVSELLQGTLSSTQPSPAEAARRATRDAGAGTGVNANRSIALVVEALHAATASETGRADDARQHFDALMRDDLSDLPYGWMALLVPVVASVACTHLADRPRAKQLYALIEPYTGQLVDGGPAWFGATTHHLANLAATLGRLDEADTLYASAVDTYTTLGAHAWLDRARLDRARVASRDSGRPD